MPNLIRFGVSLEKSLLHSFDERIRGKHYSNRSEAIRDLLRESLVQQSWAQGKEVAGAIIIVYDHHKRRLLNRLMDVQHDHHSSILSTQHIHLDHHTCLEILVVKGKSKDTEALYWRIKSIKGVTHAGFAMSTTGKEVR